MKCCKGHFSNKDPGLWPRPAQSEAPGTEPGNLYLCKTPQVILVQPANQSTTCTAAACYYTPSRLTPTEAEPVLALAVQVTPYSAVGEVMGPKAGALHGAA